MIGFAVLFGLLAVFLAQVVAQQSGRSAHEEPRSAKQSGAAGTHDRRRSQSRCGSATNSPHRRCARLRGRRTRCRPAHSARSAELTSRQAHRAHADRANEPILASKITGPGQRATLSAMLERGHEGGDRSRQRCRRRRRLRAAGRSRRCRADAPGRQEQRRSTTSCCRTCACSPSTSSPTSAPTSHRSSRPSRSKST